MPFFGQHVLQDQRIGDDEHQHDGQFAGLEQRPFRVGMPESRNGSPGEHETAPAFLGKRSHIAIDEVRNEERVYRGHCGGFGRRENPAIYAAQNDHDQQQAPERAPGRCSELTPARPGLTRKIAHTGGDIYADHQHAACDQARNDTGEEHASDRYIGGGCVDDHHDGGWNKNAQGACIADHAGGEFLRIPDLAHAGDNDGTDGNHGRGRGP